MHRNRWIEKMRQRGDEQKYRLRKRAGWDDGTGLERRPNLRFPNCYTGRRNYETVRLGIFVSSLEQGRNRRSTFSMYRWAEDPRERHLYPTCTCWMIIKFYCLIAQEGAMVFYSLARIRLVSKRASAKSSLLLPFLDAWLKALLIDSFVMQIFLWIQSFFERKTIIW